MTLLLVIVGALVITTVIIHLFLLKSLSRLVHCLRRHPVLGMGIAMVAAILGHLFEIFIFALALYWMAGRQEFGSLGGDNAVEKLHDYFYYSAVTYTSLGFGDITPVGPMRLMAAIEALTGLVLIAWTASFAFLAMQKVWDQPL
ncbi:MAG: potassium channel family protein [Planctomycetales bacterium]